jgi:hypothetical protein
VSTNKNGSLRKNNAAGQVVRNNTTHGQSWVGRKREGEMPGGAAVQPALELKTAAFDLIAEPLFVLPALRVPDMSMRLSRGL